MLFSITLLLAGFASCDKDVEKKATSIDCNKLKSALIIYDNEVISREISKITAKLNPISLSTDLIGHRSNFDIFLDNLNDCGELKAELLCYACIKTYPAQTEILITVDSVGNKVKRTIDILTPKDTCLSYKGIHTYASNNLRINKIPHPSTIICPITTNVEKDADILRAHLKQGMANLNENCDIMIDQMRAIGVEKYYDEVKEKPRY